MRKTIGDYSLILLGSFLYMLGTCLFIFPHGLLLGGTSGISVILARFIPLSPAAILSGINIVLMLLAVLILGRAMAVRTFVGSLATTLFIGGFDLLFTVTAPPVHNVFLSAILGAMIIALASGILFYVDASSGGTDIIALIIRKYSSIRIGRALLITDVVIVLLGGIPTGLASFTGLFIKTLGIDAVIALFRRLKEKKKEGQK
ncbi:MAG: YitT family protein [Ruminococcaceae bacterium]|nr:YitT family protein [Oscillospiraceae bacterium]